MKVFLNIKDVPAPINLGRFFAVDDALAIDGHRHAAGPQQQ